MESIDLEARVAEIIKKSRISWFLTIFVTLAVAASFYYYVSKITQLSRNATSLESQIHARTEELGKKEAELRAFTSGLTILQEGTRHLLNRQYEDAIMRFSDYLSLFPDSPEALNFVGYSELRYAQYWRENSVRKDITSVQKQEYLEKTKKFFDASQAHLTRSVELQPDYPWPRYNISILYWQASMKQQALSVLSALLAEAPEMVKWLCDDGQFRRMRLDDDTAEDFVSMVTKATESQSRASCWVIKPSR